MKKYIIVATLSCLVFSSCNDFLTKENPYKIESENYFTNESSLEVYTNGFIRSYATSIKSFIDGDKYTDTHNWDGTYSYYMDTYSSEDATNWTSSNWSSLRSINYYLDNMRKAEASDEVLDHYEGVGRFFRALFYYSKVKTFGAVPWYDHMIEPTSTEDLYASRTNREEVCRHILDDLNYACEHCSTDEQYRLRASYIHKYVALALKARFCLFEGTYRKYHQKDPSTDLPWIEDESEKYLKECVSACEELMKSGVYKLTDNVSKRMTQYRDMFINSDGCSVYTNEFIWARDYDLYLNVSNKDYSINDYMINAQHAQYSFNRDFIMMYLCLDGTPFTGKYSGEDYYNATFSEECTGRDYRLAQTIRTPGFTRDGGNKAYAPDIVYSKTGYQPCKFLTDEIADEISSATAVDVPIYRYAEILLDYAEAKAELGEMDQSVWNQTIAPLRERSGVKSIYPSSADPYLVQYFQNRVTDAAILEVRRERMVELTMEDVHQDDVMRWAQGELLVKQRKGLWITAINTAIDLNGDGVAETWVSNKTTEKSGMNVLAIDGASESGTILSKGTCGYILPHCNNYASYAWHDYKYLRPIPKSALLENENLKQNPGW